MHNQCGSAGKSWWHFWERLNESLLLHYTLSALANRLNLFTELYTYAFRFIKLHRAQEARPPVKPTIMNQVQAPKGFFRPFAVFCTSTEATRCHIADQRRQDRCELHACRCVHQDGHITQTGLFPSKYIHLGRLLRGILPSCFMSYIRKWWIGLWLWCSWVLFDTNHQQRCKSHFLSYIWKWWLRLLLWCRGVSVQVNLPAMLQ